MKNASRYLLPLELFMAILLLCLGVDGWVGYGPLWASLAGHNQNLEWGIALCGLGLVQLSVGFLEWCAGQAWLDRHLLRSVVARKWCAFAAVVGWLYVCYLMIVARSTDTPVWVALVAPAGVWFSIWIFAGNSKIACLLDPKVPTTKLQQSIILQRKKALS